MKEADKTPCPNLFAEDGKLTEEGAKLLADIIGSEMIQKRQSS